MFNHLTYCIQNIFLSLARRIMKTLKPKLFIGCSLEAVPIAAAVHENVRFWAEVTPWYSGVFRPSHYTLDDLEKEVRNSDFALFIFHPDDLSNIRGKYYAAVRDNTILEMGLFMGRLGRKRVFFIIPEQLNAGATMENVEGLRLPSDLLGLQPLVYELRSDEKWVSAVAVACTKIVDQMKQLGHWSNSETDRAIEHYKQVEKKKQLALFKLLRFFRELLPRRNGDTILLHQLCEALRTAFMSIPPFDVRGTAIYKTDYDGYIEQRGGNVGDLGRRYSLSVNDNKSLDDPHRIVVVDCYHQKKIKVSLYEDSFEKEYLLCYPVAEHYVITIHIIGHLDADEQLFQQIDEQNAQLFNAIHDLLGGTSL